MLYKSSHLTDKTIKTINDFQSGKIQPITLGIPHLNKACLGGLTPSFILGLAARSFSGKTFDLERIQSHIRKEHPDVVMVNSNWELGFFKILLRDIAQKTGLTQEEILYKAPTQEQLIELGKICDVHRNDNIYYQNEPVSSTTFFEDIKSVIETHPNQRIVVTIDNLENVLDDKNNQKSSIDSLLTQINRLKDMHWFISFIVLNQLNDNILQRLDNPKQHKPIERDLYSSGQFFKLCDVVYVKVLPWRMHITDKFMVFNKDAYSWLDDFKLYGNGNTASFEPFGVAYYFYLKRRGSDVKDVQDVYAERIFKKDEVKELTIQYSDIPKTISAPIFSTPTFTPPTDLSKFEMSFEKMSGAFDSEDDKSKPF